MSCKCCEYHGTDEAYLNEAIVSNEKVEALLLYDHAIAVWLQGADVAWGIVATIPVEFCPVCGAKLED